MAFLLIGGAVATAPLAISVRLPFIPDRCRYAIDLQLLILAAVACG